MKNLFIACMALLLLPLGCGFAAPEPQAPAATMSQPNVALRDFFERLKVGKKQTVVAYGTSLTKYGYWVTAMQGYFDTEFPGLVTVINSGGPGQGSDWGVSNLKASVLDNHPDLVFIECSYNDAVIRKKISIDDCRNNLDKIIKGIQEQNPKAAIVLQTMNVPWDAPKGFTTSATQRPQIEAYNEVYRVYAKEHELPLLDHYVAWNQLLKTDPDKYHELVPDGSHPNKNGRLLITWPETQALFAVARAH